LRLRGDFTAVNETESKNANTRVCDLRIGLLLFALLAESARAPAEAPSWPQFHGPRRDNVSTETGLLSSWPADGPRLVWHRSGLGAGFASISVADGLIYTAGNVGEHMTVTALDLDGTIRWQTPNGPAYYHNQAELSGSRGCPTIDGGRLYHESPTSDVICLDAKTGKPIWARNLLEAFGGTNITWALSESLLIDGSRLVCCPGAPNAGMVALDKRNGNTLWVCKGTQDQAGYASPILVEYGGVRQIVTMTAKAAIGVHADTGELLWRWEHTTPFDENILKPIHHQGRVFINSGHQTGGELLKLNVAGQKCSVELLWRTKDLDNQHGGILLVDGHLYGSCHRTHAASWVCLDFETGKATYVDRGIGKGSLTYADGRLYILNERGGVALVKATPAAHEIVGRFEIPKAGTGPVWAHPVVCGGVLYIRHADHLFAYDVKAK
jgi:outer membrane protein assembly factor BamB